MSRKGLNLDDDKTILDIYNYANEVYSGGIAVPVDGGHPCGWDWLDFDNVENILEHEFRKCEISNGCNNGEYVDRTLKEILTLTSRRFAFEVNANNVDWNED